MTKRRRKVLASFVVAFVGLAILVVVLISKLNAPAQGVISAPSNTSTSSSAIDMTPTPGGGRFATFNYPRAMIQTANQSPVTPIVATYDYTYRDVESWSLAIQVLLIPSGRLADNNSYQTRSLNPQHYQASTMTLKGQTVNIMTDTTVGGFSKVAFLVHGQYQATISLYGDDPAGSAPLQTAFNMVISSWRWLN